MLYALLGTRNGTYAHFSWITAPILFPHDVADLAMWVDLLCRLNLKTKGVDSEVHDLAQVVTAFFGSKKEADHKDTKILHTNRCSLAA